MAFAPAPPLGLLLPQSAPAVGSPAPTGPRGPSYRDISAGKKAKAPKATEEVKQELTDWTTRDLNRWSLRQERFQRDQELFQLAKPGEASRWTRNTNDVLVLNDPRTLVKKVSRIIARHPNTIEVPPVSPQLTSVAQRIENYCYAVDQSINQRWMMGLNNPYQYDRAFYLTLRGWLCTRTLIFPEGEDEMIYDPAAIFDHQIFDPANIYPYVSGGKVRRTCHIYDITAGELLEDPIMIGAEKSAISYLEGVEGTAIQKLKAVYWLAGDGGWYHAVLAGEEWIKEPTELGYNPWDTVLANGASYRATPWDDEQFYEQIGTGILDEGAENQKYLNRAATKLNALLSLEANPPITFYNADGRPQKISFEPGARNYGTRNDRMEAHRVGPQLNDYKLLWDILVQRSERAGLPAAFFAEYTGESSMAHSVLMSAGRDVLYPFTEALNQADMLKYRKFLELYRDFGPSAPLQGRSQPDALGVATTAEIAASDIQQQGVYVEVSRADMTPQETMQRLNLGMALAEKKVISLRTLRGRDWLGVKNPDKENLQVLSEQVYLNDGVIQALVPLALSETGQHMLLSVWQTLQTGMPMPGSPAAQGQPGAAPPGLPAGTVPPAAVSGNPAENVNRAPQDAITNQLRLLLGGGGPGGAAPPVPPMPSPAQQFGV